MASATCTEKLETSTAMADAETLQRIWKWNTHVPITTGNQCVHELIVDVVKLQPSTLAVCAWNGSLTYGELDARSTGLAHHMLDQGLIPGAIVAICTEKSVWMPVAQLAAMKTGCAAILIDISLPVKRLQAVMDKVQPQQILASKKARDLARTHLSGDLSRAVIDLDSPRDGCLSPSHLPTVDTSARLYVVMTSGSTGQPKAVVITHANCVAAIQYQRDFLDFQPSDRVFDFASYAFDNIWSNMMNTFTRGACLCIPSDEERKEDLIGAFHRYRVTYAHLTPSVAWFEASELPSTFRVILFGGEMLKLDQARRFLVAGIKVINSWGPAECTVTSSARPVQITDQQNPSIGLGLGACTWIVSTDGSSLVPIGEAGELWLEGPIVGEGYLGDPEKTSHAFVRDPPWLLQGTPGIPGRPGRLYRTGDLVRYNQDGTLAFVGRQDSQVKIRGQRIELGEVEFHIKEALGAKDLVARVEALVDVIKAREDADGLTLVAYMYTSARPALPVAAMKSAIDDAVQDIEDRLQKSLPPALVPAAYIPIFDVPMTATAKIDRLRMREMGKQLLNGRLDNSARPEAQKEECMGEMEQTMRRVWSEALHLSTDRIGPNDNFLRLGGDSVKAMRIAARCRAEHVSAGVADILKSSTLRELASCCNYIAGRRHREGSDQSWPLSSQQEALIDGQTGNKTSRCAVALKQSKPLDHVLLAIESVVYRHPMLRVRVRKHHEQGWEQFVVSPSPSSYTITRHIGRILTQLGETSIDIECGPSFTVDIAVRENGDCDSVLLTSSPLLVDRESWRIICHDLDRHLAAKCALALPKTSFREWCETRRQAVGVDGALIQRNQLQDCNGLTSNTVPASMQFSVDKATTQLLLNASNDCLLTDDVDILIGTMAYCFYQRFAHRTLPIMYIEQEERRLAKSLACTVGPLTTMRGVVIPANAARTAFDSIKYVKDLRRHSNSQTTHPTTTVFSELSQQVTSSSGRHGLLVQYEPMLKPLDYATLEPHVLDDLYGRATRSCSAHEPVITLTISDDGSLQIQCQPSKDHPQGPKDLATWMQSFTETLAGTVEHLASSSRRLTQSDFPLLRITYDGLEMLEEELESVGIEPEDVKDVFPCTPLQEGILLSRDMGTASYHDVWVWHCVAAQGGGLPISTSRLAAAWDAAVQQHDVLSTVFTNHPETGNYIQTVLRYTNRARMSEQVNGVDPVSYLINMSNAEFADGEPACRFTICHNAQGDVACRLEMTHAMIDPFSVDLLLNCISRGYSGESTPPRASFRDFVSSLQDKSECSRLTYWQNYLARTGSCILPGDDGQSPLIKKYEYAYLPDAVGETVAQICQERGITRSNFMQLVWSLVLAHFTGMRQVCFGYAFSGRDADIDGVEEIVGPLINVLIARIDASQEPKDILESIKRYNIDHLDYQHVSLGEIHRAMSTGRLFNTAVTVYSEDIERTDKAIQFVKMLKDDPHEYDAVLNAETQAEHLKIYLHYKTDFASSELAEKIMNRLGIMIDNVCCALETSSKESTRPATGH